MRFTSLESASDRPTSYWGEICVGGTSLRSFDQPSRREARRCQGVSLFDAASRGDDRQVESGHAFFSYSHRDLHWLEEIQLHLNGLAAGRILETWSAHRIQAGDAWYEKIEEAIERATVAILLISPPFLASEFIRREEVPRLLLRRQYEGLTIFPIMCRPSVWRGVGWLAGMQVRPRDCRPLSVRTCPQREAVVAQIAEELFEVIRRPVGTIR